MLIGSKLSEKYIFEVCLIITHVDLFLKKKVNFSKSAEIDFFFLFFKKIFFSTCVMIKQTSKMSFSHNLLPMTTRVHQNMTFWLSYEP